MDLEMKAYLDEQFGRMAERVDQNSRQIEDLREDTRHTRVLVEGMWDNVRLIAEGAMGAIEQQEAHRKEIQAAVQEIKTSVVLSYRSLEVRVQNLEDQAQRQRQDVFEAIRKAVGSSQAGKETPSPPSMIPLPSFPAPKTARRPRRRGSPDPG